MKAPHQLATLLDLFSAQRPECDAEAICHALQCSRATGYRHLKALVDEGWLSKVSTGRYALGLRIAQLHGVLMASHPLLAAAQPALSTLAQHSPWPVALSAPCGSEQLLDVLYAAAPCPLPITLQRGRLRTQWASAAGCLWLAHCSQEQQRQCYARHHADFAAHDWGRSWATWQAHLQALQHHGNCAWHTPDQRLLLGVAVPVLNPEGFVVATLSAEATDNAHAMPAEAHIGLSLQLQDAAWAIRKAQSGWAAHIQVGYTD